MAPLYAFDCNLRARAAFNRTHTHTQYNSLCLWLPFDICWAYEKKIHQIINHRRTDKRREIRNRASKNQSAARSRNSLWTRSEKRMCLAYIAREDSITSKEKRRIGRKPAVVIVTESTAHELTATTYIHVYIANPVCRSMTSRVSRCSFFRPDNSRLRFQEEPREKVLQLYGAGTMRAINLAGLRCVLCAYIYSSVEPEIASRCVLGDRV